MGARTKAREAAMQMLYGIDTTGTAVAEAVRDFWREHPGDPEDRAYADAIVRGVCETREAVDSRLREASANWRLERMSRVDRNLLRVGAWELFERSDVPREVVIDEAVELAKRYGTKDSSAFVNGVLDRIADLASR